MATNYALTSNGGSANASSYYGSGYEPSQAIDGNTGTLWHGVSGASFPQWLEITLSATRSINQVVLTFVSSQTRSYVIQIWDGSSWVTKETVTSQTETSHTSNFTAVNTNKVRYYVTADDYTNARVGEMQVWGDPAVDNTPPSDVTNLTATKISNSRVDIDSDAATDDNAVAGYQTQRRIDGGSWVTLTPTSKSFSDTENYPTTPGTYSFEYRRKAFDTASIPNYSNNWSDITDPVSITIPVTPPTADFTINPDPVVTGGTTVLTDTSTHSPTSRQWKLDGEDLATTNPYNLDTTGLEIGTHTIELFVENAGGDDSKELTFEVIDSIVAQFFEKLEICKIFNITSLGLDMPLLTADFGDGYGAGVLSGKSSGLRIWAISAQLLPDLSEYSLDFTVDEETETATYFQYFWDFFKRHIALGNKPFYFVDPRTSRKFLASFTEPRLSFEAFTAKLYSGGVQIKQRRANIEDLTFRDEDGSINE